MSERDVDREIESWRPGAEDEERRPRSEEGGREDRAEEPEQVLAWRLHRAKEAPAKTVVVCLFLAAFLAFTWWMLGFLLALTALLVLAVALHTYFLPVSYRFDREGITVDKRVFKYTYPWEQFRRFFVTTGGVVVTPFSRKTFLDTFRGVHLMLPRDPGPVLAYLARRMPNSAPGAVDSQGTAATMDVEDSTHEAETVETETGRPAATQTEEGEGKSPDSAG